LKRIFLPLTLSCVVFVGCGNAVLPPIEVFAVTGAPISGKLLSGTLPVSGAHIYLMAVATTGYGKPSFSLLDSGSTGSQDSLGAYVVTAADGTFAIPGYYSCGAQTNVYVYTSGGDSGLGQNSAATELAAIGPCPQVGAVATPVVVDEVTTVAMSFALAGFATDALHIASSGSSLALTGVANAFVNASHLAPTTTGLAPALIPSGSATVPQATINTLANILSSCIHSAGAGSPACGALLDNAGSAPPSSDTASAMIAIAHSPASVVSTLFAQQSSTPPFSPYLTVAPNDFSLGLVFTGGGINLTNGMAVDAMGNVWSTNDSYYLTEISSAGVFLSGPNGYLTDAYTPGPIAIDLNDNVWIGNGAHTIDGPGSLYELSNDGTVLSGANGYGYGLLHTPEGLAVDANNNIWVTDTVSNDVLEFSNSGQVLSGAKGFTGGGISNPYQLTISPSGDVWVTNSTVYSISELSNSGMPLTPSTGVAGVGFFGGTSLAIDRQNNVWAVTVGAGAQVSKVSPDGVILSGSGYATTAMQAADGAGVTMAIDGDDNVWTPAGASNVIELSNTGETLSGSNGYGGGIASYPQYLVIDGSGDVWVSSATYIPSGVRGVPGVYTFKITELVGVAAPVVTPIAAGVKLNMLGARP
jgi:hypothetical protein